MKTFKFQGYSDDTFGEYEQTDIDYDNCGNGKPIEFELKDKSGKGVRIIGLYGNDHINKSRGCWMIAVGAIDEDMPIDWKVTITPSYEGYRNQCVVECPDDIELVLLNKYED